MNETTLVWDVIYQILDECIEIELKESQRLADQANKSICWCSQLTLINHQCNDYILNNAQFHKLQVFYILGRTTRQRDPVIVGVDNDKSTKNNEWTMLHISLSNQQRLLPEVCMFSLLEVRPPRKTASLLLLDKDNKEDDGEMDNNNNNNRLTHTTTIRKKSTYRNKSRYWYRQVSSRIIKSGDGRVFPLLRYHRMIGEIEEFATLNSASIWCWRSPVNSWLYRGLPGYRLLLDNPENELLIWHHSYSKQQKQQGLSIGEQVLHHNVPFFANLGSPTAAQFM
ncbi:hypothetical protein BDC45DRAFT_201520 [Circinella umbellata]|nr:hypothetical protein BDC45DRAFT_201520 [Circinella umbellata]